MTNSQRLLSRGTSAAVLAIALLCHGTAAFGALFINTINNDADSGISSSNTYTHAFDLNRGGADPDGGNDAVSPLIINGVSFTGITSSAGGTDAVHGGSYTSTGINATFDNRATGVAAGGVRDLLDDFYHNGNGNGGATPGTEVITLTGLTAGQAYKTRFYVESSFGGATQDITFSDSGNTIIDIPRSGGVAPAAAVEYTYVAPVSGQISFTIDADSNGDSFHQYGFTNQEINQVFAGAGTGIKRETVDNADGPRINIDKSFSITLGPGTYSVTDFAFASGQAGEVTPFLAFDNGGGLEVIAVGDTAAVGAGNLENLVAFGGDDSFTLTSLTEIFAGIANPLGQNNPVFLDNGTPGLTDHVVAGSVVNLTGPGQIIGITNPNLGRSYAFAIAIESAIVPEPTTGLLALLGMGGLAIRRRRHA